MFSAYSEKIVLYRKVLVQEFIREFNFLMDVAANRSNAKADFTDKLSKLVTMGVGGVLDNVEVPALNVVTIGIELGLDWLNEKRKEAKQNHIEQQNAEIDQGQLRILLEMVALEASRRYEFAINVYLSDNPMEGIIPLAKAQIERMLEYVARKRLPLTQNNLLTGLIAGHSGSYITKFINTSLATKHDPKAKFRAEGLSGRPAFMTSDEKFWILVPPKGKNDTKSYHKMPVHKRNQNQNNPSQTLIEKCGYKKESLFKYGYTKLVKQKASNSNTPILEPKYGYVMVPKIVVTQFDYVEQPKDTLNPELINKLKQHPPTIQPVIRQQIEDYLSHYKTKMSFNNYIRQTNPQLTMTIYETANTKELDFTGLDFSGADFSYCILNGCTFTGSLKNTKFQYAYLINADLTGVINAEQADFSAAHLEYLNASGAILNDANLTHAHLHYADLQNAQLKRIKYLGAEWIKAKLENIQVEDSSVLEQLQKAKVDQENLLKFQQIQIKELKIKVDSQDQVLSTLQDQVKALEEQMSIFQKNKKTIEPAKQVQQLLMEFMLKQQAHATFERYCRQELEQLKYEVRTSEQKTKIQQDSILQFQNQLQKILETQAQSQNQLSILTKNSEKFIKDLNNQKISHEQLQEQVKQLEATCNTILLEQNQYQIKLTQLTRLLSALQGEVSTLRQEFISSQTKVNQKIEILDGQVQALKVQLEKREDFFTQASASNVTEILKSRYQGYQTIQGPFGKPLQLEGQYINLQMIYTAKTSEKKESGKKEEKGDEPKVFHSERISSFEDLFGTTRALKLEELFKPAKELFKEEKVSEEDSEHCPALLLIQGRAGIGKTTCTHYIANTWAHQKLWTQYKWIFRLTFRELRGFGFQSASKKGKTFALWEWIYESLMAGSLLNKSDFQKVWQAVIEPDMKAGKGLFILDGADEAPTKHPCQGALTALFTGEYQSCPKIVTSRPYHGLGYLPIKRRNLEIIGFTHENVTRYVQQYFSSNNNNTSPAETLLNLLKPNISLWSNAHIPVTLNLICGIYESGQKDKTKPLEGLTTMTGLYERMVEALTERAYLNKDNTQEQQSPLLLKEGILYQDLTLKQRRMRVQAYYQEALAFLGELAFRGLQQEAITLPTALVNGLRDELNLTPQVFIKAKQLGFIKPLLEESLPEEAGCEFLHFTFQEFFAALAIVEGLQTKSKDKREKMEQFIRHQKYNPRYQIVWWFVAGLLRPIETEFKTQVPKAEAFKHYLNLLLEISTRDLLRHYELGLLVRIVEESYGLATLLTPVLARLQQAFLSLYQNYQKRGEYAVESIPLISMLKLSPNFLQLSGQKAITVSLPWLETEIEAVKGHLNFIKMIGIATPVILTYVHAQLTQGGKEVRKSAAGAVEGIGAAAATPEILKALSVLLTDKDELVQRCAAGAVHGIGAAAATPEILKVLGVLLTDKDELVQRCAAWAVHGIGAAAATPEILKILGVLLVDKDEQVRWSAAEAVKQIGAAAATPEILKALTVLLADKDYDVQRNAVEAVGMIGAAAATPEFLKALGVLLADKDMRVKMNAVGAVKGIGPAAATPEFLKALGVLLADKDMGVQINAVEAVGMIGAAAATPEFLKTLGVLLADKNTAVQMIADHAVGEIGAAAATPEFLKTLSVLLMDKEEESRMGALLVVRRIGAAAVTPEFLKTLSALLADKDKDIDVQMNAVRAFKAIGAAAVTPEFSKTLNALLTDKDHNVRERAVRAVGMIGAAAATPEILKALGVLLMITDKEQWVQVSAVWAVGELGAAAATPEFLKTLGILLANKDEGVRWRAAEAIGRIGAAAATPDILKALGVLLADEDEGVWTSAIDAVKGIGAAAGTPDILKALKVLLADKNERVRKSAAQALKKIEAAAIPEFLKTLDTPLMDKGEEVWKSIAEAVQKSIAEAVQGIGADIVTSEFLKTLGVLLADKNREVCNNASVDLQILAKRDFIRLYHLWHSLSQTIDKDILAEAIPCLAAITIGGYLAGTAQMQVLWVDNAYQIQIYVGPRSFKESLTSQQAQIFRHLMPLIINRFEEQGLLVMEELMEIVKQLPEPFQDLKLPELQALSKPFSGKEEVPPLSGGNLWASWLIEYKELKFEEGELGKGSYGIVYQGTYRNNPVAIKQLQLTSPSLEAIQEFTNEMKIMFKLRCPQIITLYGVYLTPSYGIVMEFMPNKSLFEILKNKVHPFEWSIRYPIAVDITKGVAFLHKAGVLHRDLKSLNVLVNEHWRAKLTDFGISKFKDETKSLSSNKGSLLWIAPERLSGEKHTEQSDIYSLGMTLLELASRELPFKEAKGDEEKIRQSIKEDRHDPIPSDCPSKVGKVIQLCWLMEAKKRPTAEEVLEQLQAPDIEELLNNPGTIKLNTSSSLSLTNKN